METAGRVLRVGAAVPVVRRGEQSPELRRGQTRVSRARIQSGQRAASGDLR